MALDLQAIPVYKDSFETSSSTWQDVIRLPASVFAASGKYVLLVTCGVDSNGDDSVPLDGSIEVRVVHGSTEFADSVALLLPTRPTLAPAFYRHYGWMEIHTQGGSPEAVTLQIKRHATGDADHQVYAVDISMMALCLDNLVENTDYWVDENDDTGAPLALSSGGQTIIDRTFADIGPTDDGTNSHNLAAFIFCSVRHNNTDVATKLELSRTELNEPASTINKWVLARQTPLHTDERLATMVPDGILVGDTNDALFRLKLFEVGGTATHHEHMVTRVVYIRYYSTAVAVNNAFGFENHGDLFTPITRTVGLTPKHVMFNGLVSGSAQYQILTCRASVTPFIDELETTVFLTKNVDYPGYTEAGADAGRYPPNFFHVVGDNASIDDITPQVRIAAKGYTNPTPSHEPVAFMDNGDFGSTVVMTNFEFGTWQIEDLYHFVDHTVTGFSFSAVGVATNSGPQNAGAGTVSMGSFAAVGAATGTLSFAGVGNASLGSFATVGAANQALTAYEGDATVSAGAISAVGAAAVTIPPIANTAAVTMPGFAAVGAATRTLAPCAAHQYDQFGRQPIGVSQMFAYGADYPFVDPSPDIRYLLADFYLAYDDPSDYNDDVLPFEPPFTIAWFFGYGCNVTSRPDFVTASAFHACDVIVRDAHDRVVFDSTAADHYTDAWSDRLDIHEWISDSATCRAVVHTRWHTADGTPVPQDYDIHITPDNGTLDPRCVHRMPQRVRKLIIGDEELVGEISFANGYNTEYDDEGAISDPSALLSALGATGVASEGGRAGRRIGLSAVAGSGLGRSPGCDELSLNILTINNIQPDEFGNLILNSEDCYWFEQPADRDGQVVFTPATLMIHNDCVPCCPCEDYVAVKLGIDSLYARWLRIATEALRIRDVYVANRDRWTADVACRLANQNQRLTLVTNCSGYVGVGYAFCTQAETCTGPLEVRFDVQVNPAPGERPNPNPDDQPSDPDSDGDGVDDADEEPITGFGPELLDNPQFSQGLDGWTYTGAVRHTGAGAVEMGHSGAVGNSLLNLTLNPDFAGNAASWTVTGNAAYTAASPIDYVRVGGGAGGFGKLRQTMPVDPGEQYRLLVFYDYCIGTCRIKLIDANGVEQVTTLSVVTPATGNPSTGTSLFATAATATYEALVESEFGAANSVHVNKVWLTPRTGTLSQEVTGLTPGTETRLKVDFLFNVIAFTVEFLDADDNVLFTENVALSGFAHSVTGNFTPGTETGTVRVKALYDAFGGVGQITAISVQQIVTEDAPEDDEIANQYEMQVSYVPNTARRNDVTSARMRPYTMGGAFPTLTATWEKLNPGHAGRLTFMCFICNGIDGDSVTVTATPTLDGEELESVSETIALLPACPTEEELCGE